ncbi:FAD-dependent oxidoreductase [Clostridium saccharoperbutylacetonicum]|uniref:oxidoreductase n=1 Tax=Clostridium saccharoperbutylacetonicum TaxID=36745 RepID=UPI000983EF25|nr:FAD-dependent oxidoreductase [Clostridium saccharoperbutylacetonicum]AQR96832.1 NADH oxidase [Clostridium saccharoperbutylacetonicum]NSB32710.1 2,4-dienoyl-CoA reductase-like NADH-dependent reductase (Old Yellow Enzyme family)/thioredoxin reductase [Clostridium saccharoperbutylacetonicum]
MDKKSNIFKPIQIGNITAQNRIEISPAGSFLCGRDGGNTPEFIAYVKSLAKSGAGIVTLGVSSIDEQSSGVPITNVGNSLYISDLADLVEVIHRYGALASIELVSGQYMLTPPEVVATQSSKEEIEHIIKLFSNAAERCMIAGFDMIMIHGGHGNVPAMFFSKKHNHRTDEYGGTFENRCRFGQELLGAIRKKVGNKIAIEYRISAEELLEGSSELEETLEYAKKIQDKVDIMHVSRGLLEEESLLPYLFQPTYFPRAMNLEAAKRFKKELNIPVSVVGSFDLDTAEEAVSNGDVDVVAMIRNILADTNCVRKAYKGKSDEIRPCVRCNTCINRTHTQFIRLRCAVNPLVGRETQFSEIKEEARSKKVVIIGGGPAGLEAARISAKKGYSVVVFEKNSELGGALRMASIAPFKKDMQRYLDWSIRSVINNPKIEVKLNTLATKENVLNEKPDAVLIGVGAKPIIPRFTLSDSEKVAWVGDVESKKASVGQDIVMVGAGFTGLEAAFTLAQEGKNVKVIDMIPEERIGADGIQISMIALKELLKKEGVTFECEVKLSDITEEGAIIEDKAGNKKIIKCDTVILSLGVKADRKQVELFEAIVNDVYAIGDCATKGGTLWNATRTGFDAAMDL